MKNHRSTRNSCPTPPRCTPDHLQRLNTLETIHSSAYWSSFSACFSILFMLTYIKAQCVIIHMPAIMRQTVAITRMPLGISFSRDSIGKVRSPWAVGIPEYPFVHPKNYCGNGLPNVVGDHNMFAAFNVHCMLKGHSVPSPFHALLRKQEHYPWPFSLGLQSTVYLTLHQAIVVGNTGGRGGVFCRSRSGRSYDSLLVASFPGCPSSCSSSCF